MRLRAGLAVVIVAASLAVAAPAAAETEKFGTFNARTSSPSAPTPADYAYSRTSGIYLDASQQGSRVVVTVGVPEDHRWTAIFSAPNFAPLVPGVYENAEYYFLRVPDRPGLDVSGEGAGCGDSITGRFTVHEAVFGPNNWVERFRATYEQTCNWSGGTVVGDVDINNGPYPAAMAVGSAVDPTAVLRRDGTLIASGTNTCTRTTSVELRVVVSQRGAQEEGWVFAHCFHWMATPWSAELTPAGGAKLRPGPATVTVSGQWYDDDAGAYVPISVERAIRIRP